MESTRGDADPGRVAALDLLRGVAALSVALPHFFAYRGVQPEVTEAVSALAVEVFFVLSGYVLAPQILLCLGAGRPRHLGVFLVRRWMRTIPPYLVALVMISFLSRRLASTDFLRYLSYTQNLFRQSNADDYFAIAWSLSVEEWFYVCFPSLLMAAAWLARRRDRGFAVLVAIGFCAVVAVGRLLFGDFADWGGAVRRVVVFRLDSIGYGFLLYLALARLGDRVRRLSGWAAAGALLAAAALAFGALWRVAEAGDLAAEHAFPFAAALFGATAIICAARGEAAVQRMPPLARLGVYLGRVSYSTYLFHIIAIELIAALAPGLGAAAQLAVFLVALFGFTTAFYVWFEQPILAGRPRYRGGRPAALEPVSAAADRR